MEEATNQTPTTTAPVEQPVAQEKSPIEKAESLVKTIETKQKEITELLARQEEIANRMILGGRSQAGQINQITPEEQKRQEVEKIVTDTMKRYGYK